MVRSGVYYFYYRRIDDAGVFGLICREVPAVGYASAKKMIRGAAGCDLEQASS